MSKKALWGVIVALLMVWFLPQPAIALSQTPEPGLGAPTALASNRCQTQPQNQLGSSGPTATSLNLGVLPKIGAAHLRSGLLPGTIIGGHYEGMLRLLQQHYTASGQLDEHLEEAIQQSIAEELANAGYNVSSSESSSLFDEQMVEEAEPVRFLIGGTVTKVALNSYSSWLDSHTSDQRTIKWEIFDRDTNKVIARQETTGEAIAPGIDNPAATFDAIRASFQALLAHPKFTDVLQKAAAQEVISASATSYQIAALPSPTEALTVEQIATHSIPAIVGIRTPIGRGSGFFIDDSGLILTNHHVVGSAFSVQVNFYDGSTKVGRVVKRNPAFDVALVKVEGDRDEIAALPLADLNTVKVGQEVVAIGNPLAFSNSVTKGIVSGIRMVGSRDLIQTDVAINPGNSGGPLLNQQGAVIGIVTEKMVSRGIEGIGFALPIAESLHKLNIHVAAPTLA